MDNFAPNVFDIEAAGMSYVVEFNREGIKEADELGVFDQTKGLLYERPSIILFAGLKMHQRNMTINLARKIWRTMVDEEGYTVQDFNDTIGDEFFRCYNAFFTDTGTKKIMARKK